MMDGLDFSEEEIREQLAILGYRNIPKHRLQEFKKDLDELILRSEFRHLDSPPQCGATRPQEAPPTRPSPPSVTREKVNLCFGDGFFLHASQSDHQRQEPTPCHRREFGQGEGLPDSYAQHSVAPKLWTAVSAPSRLRADEEAESESEPDSRLRPPLSDSRLSCVESQGRRLIKRKVLRKHGGQSLVCDESIYSENSAHRYTNKMYQDQSDHDHDSLNSSFWSDGDREEVQLEGEVLEEAQVVTPGDGPVKASGPEASEEEKPEVKPCDGSEESSEDGSIESDNDDDDDDGDEREEDDEEEREEAKIARREGVRTSEEEESEMSSRDESEEGSEGEYDDTDGSEEEEEEEEDGEEPEEVLNESVAAGTSSKPSEESARGASDQEEPELHVCARSEGSSEGGGDDTEDDEEPEDGDDEEEEEEEEEEQQQHQPEGGEEPVTQPAPEDEKLVTSDKRKESSEGGDDGVGDGHETEEEEKEEEEEEDEDGSCESPAPSLMTSGYGTFRPEELEESGGLRGDGAAEDEDSRGDLSEDGRSLCSFSVIQAEPDALPAPPAGGEDELHQEVEVCRRSSVDEEEQEKSHKHLVPPSEEKSAAVAPVEEEEQGEERHLQEVNSCDESSSNPDIKFIDSKVDLSQMTVEEMCEGWEGNLRRRRRSSSDTTSSLEERLEDLRLTRSPRRDPESDEEEELQQQQQQQQQQEEEEEEEERRSHSSSSSSGISVDAFETYFRSVTHTRSDAGVRSKPKSFIRPVASQPAVKKTDPVTKYFQYKQIWELFKLPGQREHRALRQEIRDRLAYQPPPPKPRRVFVPNTYQVPTEKKRSALRWEVRNELAKGLVPYRVGYPF